MTLTMAKLLQCHWVGRTAGATELQSRLSIRTCLLCIGADLVCFTSLCSPFGKFVGWNRISGETDRQKEREKERKKRNWNRISGETERKNERFESHLRRDFSGSSHTSDLKIGTPVATLPGVWRYRVSVGTSWPGVSILLLGEMESLICNFYLRLAARKIAFTDPCLRYTRMLLGR